MKFKKIKAINKAGISQVYHLSVKNNNNFFANKICVHNCYRGGMGIKLYNLGDLPYTVSKGDRIAQIVPHKLIQPEISWAEEAHQTDRGESGFGSSGK